MLLAYRMVEAGPTAPAGAEPMVLLHGGGGDNTTWDDLAPQFARRRRVYLPDLRGMGASASAGPFAMTDLRDDLLAMLDHWKVDRAVLIGHSLGGFVSLLTALSAPERVAALVLEECPPPVPLGLDIPARVPGSAPFYDRAIRPTVLATLNAPDPAWSAALPSLTVPTLVLGGGPESFLPQEKMADVAAALPAGRFETIPAGHSIHPAEPAAFTAAVESFLASHS